MDDLAEALQRAADFSGFENKQRYMRWMIAMRQEILRLQAAREKPLTGNSVGGTSAAHRLHHKSPVS